MLDEDERAAMPAVVAAWMRWAAELAGLDDAAVADLDEAAVACAAEFADVYDDVANASPARLFLAGVDKADGPADLQGVLDRRLFAMPYVGTRIGDEDFPHLDPGDPDERRLLVIGEHPQYHAALDDPGFHGEVDGVDPRLHVTLHEIVAAQLWDDDPPEVWQAAQRLLATGADRHDVLHALAHVLARHLHSATATPTSTGTGPTSPRCPDAVAVRGRSCRERAPLRETRPAGSAPTLWNLFATAAAPRNGHRVVPHLRALRRGVVAGAPPGAAHVRDWAATRSPA